MRAEQIAKYWDEYAAEYDQEPDHGLLDSDTRLAWKDLLRMWLPPHASDVADLACGTGTLSALAAELGHRVRGFDLSSEMVARARAKTAHFGAAVQIEQADVSAPPWSPTASTRCSPGTSCGRCPTRRGFGRVGGGHPPRRPARARRGALELSRR